MRILAIEASGLTAQVALLESGRPVSESTPDTRRSAQSLAPSIHKLLQDAGWRPPDIDLVSVTVGPGSFTGVRVGVTTAKVFAWACDAEILGVNTLDVMAFQAKDGDFPFHAAVNAHRKQVFAARYENSSAGENVEASRVLVVDINAWLASIAAGETIGTPLAEQIGDRLPAGVRILEPQMAAARASSLGELASIRYASGERNDLHATSPNYYRPSAAEEKRGGV